MATSSQEVMIRQNLRKPKASSGRKAAVYAYRLMIDWSVFGRNTETSF